MLQDPINNSALALKGYPVKIFAYYYYYYYYYYSVRRITRTGYMISCYLIGSHKTKTLSRPRKD